MDIYWICSDCGTANPYPANKRCDVCDKEIDESEIRQAENSLKTIQKQVQAERQYELKEKKLAYQQAQNRKKELLAEKRRLLRRKRALLIEERNEKAFGYFQKAVKIAKVCLIVLVVCSLVVVGVSMLKNNGFEPLSERINTRMQAVIKAFSKTHFVTKKGVSDFIPFYNIRNRIMFLSKYFMKSENVKRVLDMLGG